MNARLLQTLLALSLLLNTFVLVGFVYRSWMAPPFEMHPPPPPRAGPVQPSGPRFNPVETVVRDLGLDGEQRQRMKDTLDRYANGRRERLLAIQRVREQTGVELGRTPVDMSRIDGLIDQVSHLRAELQKDTLHTLLELQPSLRPEQRERLQELLVDRVAPPPRPPAGGPPRTPK